MASVIASARRSTASVFDVVTDVATAASRTLASATLAADTIGDSVNSVIITF